MAWTIYSDDGDFTGVRVACSGISREDLPLRRRAGHQQEQEMALKKATQPPMDVLPHAVLTK
jgi:hypothetical protein